LANKPIIVCLYDRLGETGLQRFGSLYRYLDLRLNSADQSSSIDRIRCDFPSIETPERLTWRETEILRLVERGYNNREISEALTIAEGTVKNYISGILWKMGVRDRTRAVLKGLEAGYL
jgi:DNA-binding NarL/FixJ family response regulator